MRRAAISRAVRTPSRVDHDLEKPGILALAPDYESEKLVSYDLGYRAQLAPQTSVSVSFYWNQHSDLRTLNFIPNSATPYLLRNDETGNAYLVDAWGDRRVLPWWKPSAGDDLMHKVLRIIPGMHATDEADGDDPGYQFSFRSSMDLPHNVEFDFGIEVVDRLPDPTVRGYVQANARIAWHDAPALELSLSGNNLPAAYHLETVEPGIAPLEVQRSIYLGLRWKY
jgi:iron complex outermembrane receptor protein